MGWFNAFKLWLTLTLLASLTLLAGCSDPRDKTEGTAGALATYSVADKTLEKAKLVLGAAYYDLRSARTANQFRARTDFFTSEQSDAMHAIQRQLGNCISVIEKEPATRAAALADLVIQQNHGFLTTLPSLYQSWIVARQRMPRQ